MATESGTRHLYGKAIGVGLAGLAGLATEGIIIAPAVAGPVYGGWDLKKNTKAFYEPPPDSSYKLGASVGRGSIDADGDGLLDIVSTSVGGSDSTLGFIKIDFSNSVMSVIKFQRPYSFADSIDTRVAIGDLDRDGVPDIVAGAASGASSSVNVTSFDKLGSLSGSLESTAPFDHAMTNGVYLSISNAAGTKGVVVASSSRSATDADGTPTGPSSIRTGELDLTGVPLPHDGQLTRFEKWHPNFYAYGDQYSGGIRVATGDVDGDGLDDVVTLNESGSTRVARIHKHSPDLTLGLPEYELYSQFEVSSGSPDDPSCSIAVGDIDDDGLAEVVLGSAQGSPPQVRIFTYDPNTPPGPEGTLIGSWSLLSTLDVFDPSYLGGVDVGLTDLSGDGTLDLVFAQSMVPEPTTALAIFGAGLLMGRRRRRVMAGS